MWIMPSGVMLAATWSVWAIRASIQISVDLSPFVRLFIFKSIVVLLKLSCIGWKYLWSFVISQQISVCLLRASSCIFGVYFQLRILLLLHWLTYESVSTYIIAMRRISWFVIPMLLNEIEIHIRININESLYLLITWLLQIVLWIVWLFVFIFYTEYIINTIMYMCFRNSIPFVRIINKFIILLLIYIWFYFNNEWYMYIYI